MKQYAILNGPNLNQLGQREMAVYGARTLSELEAALTTYAQAQGCGLVFYQSNHEGALIDQLQAWSSMGIDGCIFNPGAYTHTSIALHDALLSCPFPCIEVHLSNIYAREAFRRQSVTAPAMLGVIAGFGFESYRLALQFLVGYAGKAVRTE